MFRFDGFVVFLTVGAEVDCLIDSSLEVVDEPPQAFLGDSFFRCSIGYNDKIDNKRHYRLTGKEAAFSRDVIGSIITSPSSLLFN